MFGSTILEIAIGIIFIYLLMSLLCSAANEIIESFLKNRATDLERGIRELFNQEGGGDLVGKFYNHPLIKGLFRGSYEEKGKKGNDKITFWNFITPTNLPAYVPKRNFANALLDLVMHPPSEESTVRDDSPRKTGFNQIAVATAVFPTSMPALRTYIKINQGDTQVGRALRTLAEQSGNDLNNMRENIENWFDSSMDRVSGAYKRRTQWILFGLGLVISILLNVNTVTILKRLSTDSALRSIVVAQAGEFVKRPENRSANLSESRDAFEENRKAIEGLGLPIGWSDIRYVSPAADEFRIWNNALLPFLGWLLTALAVSLGAPFWFDLLNKFMVVRSTVKPHEKSPEESSEDRQLPSKTIFPGLTAAIQTSPGTTGSTAAEVIGSPIPPESAPADTPEPKHTNMPDAEDGESDLDGCGIPLEAETADEDLPPSKGGVE